MTLWSLFQNNTSRPIHKWNHYFPVYESHFARYVNRPLVFLEIGCGNGGSLKMWKNYFGPFAQIVGIDINSECKQFEEDQIAVRIGDQSDEKFLESVCQEFGEFDIVLDDGSHVMEYIKATFSFLYPNLSKNGIYMVEDLHTAYWNEFGGGVRSSSSFIEFAKDCVDQLNIQHTRGKLDPTPISKSTQSIHFYDSMVVFEKAIQFPKKATFI